MFSAEISKKFCLKNEINSLGTSVSFRKKSEKQFSLGDHGVLSLQKNFKADVLVLGCVIPVEGTIKIEMWKCLVTTDLC